MAMDVTFEDEQEVITGATEGVGVKMTDAPKPPAPPVSAPGEQRREAMRLRGAAAPASGDSGAKGLMGTVKSAEDAQRLIDRLMGSPKFREDYANSNNPDRAKLVEGLSGLFKLANPEPGREPEGAEVNALDVLPDLRREAGVPHPDLGGAQFHPTDEANYLNYVIAEGIPAATATAMTEWYATRAVTAGWQPLTAEDKEDFKAAFASRLRPDQISKLINWYDVEVMPRLGGRG